MRAFVRTPLKRPILRSTICSGPYLFDPSALNSRFTSMRSSVNVQKVIFHIWIGFAYVMMINYRFSIFDNAYAGIFANRWLVSLTICGEWKAQNSEESNYPYKLKVTTNGILWSTEIKPFSVVSSVHHNLLSLSVCVCSCVFVRSFKLHNP